VGWLSCPTLAGRRPGRRAAGPASRSHGSRTWRRRWPRALLTRRPAPARVLRRAGWRSRPLCPSGPVRRSAA